MTPGDEPLQIALPARAEAASRARKALRALLEPLGLDADGLLRVEVLDSSEVVPPLPTPTPSADAESGRGLLLVEALAERWGGRAHPWRQAPVVPAHPRPGGAGLTQSVRSR